MSFIKKTEEIFNNDYVMVMILMYIIVFSSTLFPKMGQYMNIVNGNMIFKVLSLFFLGYYLSNKNLKIGLITSIIFFVIFSIISCKENKCEYMTIKGVENDDIMYSDIEYIKNDAQMQNNDIQDDVVGGCNCNCKCISKSLEDHARILHAKAENAYKNGKLREALKLQGESIKALHMQEEENNKIESVKKNTNETGDDTFRMQLKQIKAYKEKLMNEIENKNYDLLK